MNSREWIENNVTESSPPLAVTGWENLNLEMNVYDIDERSNGVVSGSFPSDLLKSFGGDEYIGENVTSITWQSFPDYIRITSTLLCSIILIIGVIGNILVPLVVWRIKDLRSSTNFFLVNLCIADLLLLLICMPPIFIELQSSPDEWTLGEFLCKFLPFVELTLAHSSIMTILAISLERYIAICQPLKANYTCTKTRAIWICITIWVFAFIATSPMLFLTEYQKGDSPKSYVCTTPVNNYSLSYYLISITLFFSIPFFLLVILYWIISRHLISSSDTCSNAGSIRYTSSEHPNLKSRRKVVGMLACGKNLKNY